MLFAAELLVNNMLGKDIMYAYGVEMMCVVGAFSLLEGFSSLLGFEYGRSARHTRCRIESLSRA